MKEFFPQRIAFFSFSGVSGLMSLQSTPPFNLIQRLCTHRSIQMDFFVKVLRSLRLGYAHNSIRHAVQDMDVVVIQIKHNAVEVNRWIELDVRHGKGLKRTTCQK